MDIFERYEDDFLEVEKEIYLERAVDRVQKRLKTVSGIRTFSTIMRSFTPPATTAKVVELIDFVLAEDADNAFRVLQNDTLKLRDFTAEVFAELEKLQAAELAAQPEDPDEGKFDDDGTGLTEDSLLSVKDYYALLSEVGEFDSEAHEQWDRRVGGLVEAANSHDQERLDRIVEDLRFELDFLKSIREEEG